VKRWGAFAVAVAAIVVGLASPARAAEPNTTGCDAADCGNHDPQCWPQAVRARPGLTRSFGVSCTNLESARLLQAPEHVSISNVEGTAYALRFDARPDDSAGRFGEAVFEIAGNGKTAEVRVSIEVVPQSENTPPVCSGSPVQRRTDGATTVVLELPVSCWDNEWDEFTMEGGGPGVHLDSPKPYSSNWRAWRYRTATAAGTETTRVWATDFLGARSADAEIEVTVGPGVDRLPTCGMPDWTVPVFSRPGAIRRFGVFCMDEDGDPVVGRLSTPPSRGAIVAVPVETQVWPGYAHQSIDVTYTPTSDSTDPDEFAFTPTGTHGDGAAARMAIIPRALPENMGGVCQTGGNYLEIGVPGTVSARCTDDDGDPLTAEVVIAPKHGTAGPPLVTQTTFGDQQITLPYLPNGEFNGYDCVKLKVSDGHGFSTEIVVDIHVVASPPTSWDYGPPMPAWPPMLPPGGPMPPLNPQAIRTMAQRALGTGAVKRVRRGGGSEVWARSKLSKGDLLRNGRAPAMAVICLVNCQIRSDATLAGLPSVKAARRKASAARTPGQTHVVTLDLTKREQRALRRARKPRGSFKVSVRPAGGKAQPLTRSIPVAR